MFSFRKRWLIGWALVLVLLGSWLIFAEKPWGEIAEDAELRKEIGKLLKVRHYSTVALWWTGLASWIVIFFAGFGLRWWVKPLDGVTTGFVRGPKTPRYAWVGLIVILVIGAALRVPFASKSLAVDELWNAKSTIVGYYLGNPDDTLDERFFGEATFPRALWFYPRPNNHPVASVAARLSHVLISDLIDPDRLQHEFRDLTLRFPTLLVSLGCIALMGYLGFRFVGAVTGLVAALLLAVQPWHIQFGLEIRGYSWVLLWSLLGIWCLTKIFRQGEGSRWRYWFLFGLIQALIVWSFSLSVFLAAGFFLGMVALIFLAWPDRQNRVIALRRLVLVNVLGGLLFLQIFGPNLLQTREWFQTVSDNHQDHDLNWFRFRETVFESTVGYSKGISLLFSAFPLFALASALWGAVVLWRNPGQRPLFIALGSVALGVVLLFAAFLVTKSYYYPRFASFGIVPLIFLMAIGWTSLKTNHILPILGCVAMVTVAEPRLRELQEKPLEPLRDVSGFLKSQDGNIIPVGYGHRTEYLNVYLPSARKPLENRNDVQAVIKEARTKDRPLFIVIGRPAYNRISLPDGFELLDDPELFEERVAFEAVETPASYRILQLKQD